MNDFSWWIFGLASLVAVTIAFLTVGFQSIRAAMINPVKSLRNGSVDSSLKWLSNVTKTNGLIFLPTERVDAIVQIRLVLESMAEILLCFFVGKEKSPIRLLAIGR